MKTGLFLFSILSVCFAQANYSGTVTEAGSAGQKVLFTYTNQKTVKDGTEEVLGQFKDPAGQVVIEEKAILNGAQVVRVETDQRQLGRKGLIEVKDGKVYFTKTGDGKSSTKDEKLGSTFVVSANFQRFIRDNWKDISAGKTVSFRYGVWDRQETVGFEIFKIGEGKVGDQAVTVLKMKPSSFVIAALVKPIEFSFAADGSKLLLRKGRVEPKQKVGDSFKDLDAEMSYSY